MVEFMEGKPAKDLPRSIIRAESYLPKTAKNFVLEYLGSRNVWVDLIDILREAAARLPDRNFEIMATVSFIHLHRKCEKFILRILLRRWEPSAVGFSRRSWWRNIRIASRTD